MPSSKRDRKNAKQQASAITAAVTKQNAAKLAASSSDSSPVSKSTHTSTAPSSPPAPSPERPTRALDILSSIKNADVFESHDRGNTSTKHDDDGGNDNSNNNNKGVFDGDGDDDNNNNENSDSNITKSNIAANINIDIDVDSHLDNKTHITDNSPDPEHEHRHEPIEDEDEVNANANDHDNGREISGHSPSLDVLSTTSVSASTAPSIMNDWRGTMVGSPTNNISPAGESPPTQPSSYEDSGRLHHGWSGQRAFMTPSPASPSPPISHRRPLSFQMEAQFATPDALPRAMAAPPPRRSSLQSPFTHARTGSHPPLPHQPQAHFYGVTDLDSTLKPESGMKAGELGLFFGFDKLPTSSPHFPDAEEVIVAGYQGGLEIYTVSKRGLELAASLKGLRGGVHHAKILPWTVGGDGDSIFPLVAVVVHGPVLPTRSTEGGNEDDDPRGKTDGAASPRSVYTHQDNTLPGRKGHPIEAYQTTVEVYSLRTNKLVEVILQAPKIPINAEVSLTSPLFQPPPPTGALTVKADAGTIAVCSGSTGECWIYTQLLEAQNGHVFACISKLWTCLQQSQRGDVAEEHDNGFAQTAPPRISLPAPIIALSGKRIAYCPPSPSSHISIRAHLPVPITGRGLGVASLTPPHLPIVTTAVDQPDPDSVVNKIMRETTQELISGAKWVGQQSLQAWHAYWNKSTSPQAQQQQGRSPPFSWTGGRSPRNDTSQFPPTHGASGQVQTKDPGVVCIVDVDTLCSSATLHPLATFAVPLGCSFLSFSPSSQALFTASSKGDVQTVWDLLRIQHTLSSPLQTSLAPGESVGPLVRQIAQFSRMTVARIIDVAWTEPQGEKLAMVTERGTIHLLELPFSALMWPPPRRRKVAPKPAVETSETPSSAVAIASGAFGAAYQAAKPFVTRSRQGSSHSSATTGSLLKDSAAQGGRVLAASITSSIGKTGSFALHQLRHTGENRFSLPPSAVLPSSSCVTWISGRRTTALFSLGGGLVRTYSLKSRRAFHYGTKRGSRARYTDFRVPLLPDDVIAPSIRQILEPGAQEEYLDLSDADLDDGATLMLKTRTWPVSAAENTFGSTIPQAEIECSAPYQPFHTDRRVALCEYTRADAPHFDAVVNMLANVNASLDNGPRSGKRGAKGQHKRQSPSAPWAFGQEISVMQLDMGQAPDMMDGDYDDYDDDRALPASAMERVMEYGDEEQIVVTTRRRRGAHQSDGDGFFEDDCEVLDFADQRV